MDLLSRADQRGHFLQQFQGRLETLYSEAYAMINSLGVDGMSSDDTDGEEYPVRAPVWRTPEVITVLNHLDGCRKSLGPY